MAAIPIQDASSGLGGITLAAAANGDTIAAGTRHGGWDLATVLIVQNASASSITVTIAGMPGSPWTVAAGAIAIIPVYAIAYGAPVTVVYSATATVNRAAVRLAPAP